MEPQHIFGLFLVFLVRILSWSLASWRRILFSVFLELSFFVLPYYETKGLNDYWKIERLKPAHPAGGDWNINFPFSIFQFCHSGVKCCSRNIFPFFHLSMSSYLFIIFYGKVKTQSRITQFFTLLLYKFKLILVVKITKLLVRICKSTIFCI